MKFLHSHNICHNYKEKKVFKWIIHKGLVPGVSNSLIQTIWCYPLLQAQYSRQWPPLLSARRPLSVSLLAVRRQSGHQTTWGATWGKGKGPWSYGCSGRIFVRLYLELSRKKGWLRPWPSRRIGSILISDKTWELSCFVLYSVFRYN